ncbi:hypothetical protein [Sandarakinorhabdus sp. DWP1-3-1]|uniref:hypothetical protein n=1 Tax=Sandarakinorhabdus sp. DWP1-3-1 TaxID=2804627 RepID=UPI003CF4E293
MTDTATAIATATGPGFLALVRHELRLAIREGAGRQRKARLIVLLVLMLVPALAGVGLAISLAPEPDVPRAAFGYVAAGWAGLVLLMLSGACVYVLRAFHDRGDLDLLLAAPISPARVLAAKSVAVHASVALPLLLLSAPFVIASVATGHPGWAGGSLMIVVAAVIATSMAFVIAGGLFRSLGSRRARMVIQAGGGIFAACVAILGQTPTFMPDRFEALKAAIRPAPPPPLDWPARAIFGAPLPLLALVLVALGFAYGAARLAARNLADAAPIPVATVSNHVTRPFRGGVLRSLLTKELVLLWRDPELLSAVALQLAYMVPAFGLIFAGGTVSTARLVAATVLFAAMLPSSLGWLTLSGEDAPDLIASAPVPAGVVNRVKVLAACLPSLLLALVPLTFIAMREPSALLVAVPMCLLGGFCAALQQQLIGRPQKRSTFRRRQSGSMLLAISEYVMAGGFAGTAALLVQGSPWAALPAALSLAVLGVSWLVRTER